MKSLIFLLVFIATASVAQIPQSFKYQALLRDEHGKIVDDQNISIKISVLKTSIAGETVYSERHNATTSAFGTVNLEIGKGLTPIGSFTDIDWGSDLHFVKVEMDLDGNNVFEEVGTAQLLSVPYSLYAARSGDEKWASSGNNIFFNTGNVGIGTSSPLEKLHLNGSIRGNQLGGALRVSGDYGYMDIGSKNPDYSHFYTNMPYGFYFGNNLTVSGQLIGYHTADLFLSTQSSGDYQPVKRMTILNSNGNVGIAKTNPQYTLDVNGTINATSVLMNGSPISKWTASGSNIYFNSGNVGIGTSSPLEKLHLNGSIRGNQLGGALRVSGDYGYMDIGGKNPDYAHFYTNMPYGFYFGNNLTISGQLIGYHNTDLFLSTQSGVDYQPVKRMTILNSNGYVGIGTQQPKAQVQVENGDIYLKGSGSGVIMKSPDGQCWKLTVDNSGNPQFSSVTCPD